MQVGNLRHLKPLAVKSGIDHTQHRGHVQLAAKKFIQPLDRRRGGLEERVMFDRQYRKSRRRGQPLFRLLQLAAINFREERIVARFLALALEHRALAGQDFFQRPAHQDDAILQTAIGRQLSQEQVDNLDRMPAAPSGASSGRCEADSPPQTRRVRADRSRRWSAAGL